MNSLDRSVVFIDGPNLYGMSARLNIRVDFKSWLAYFRNDKYGQIYRHYYFTAVDETEEYQSIRPLIDWLNYNGFSVVTKPTKSFQDREGRRKVKGNMDIELAVTALGLAQQRAMQRALLVTGDGDFAPLVTALKGYGVHVTVVGTIQSSPPMVADELRREADAYVDLADIREHIVRPDQQSGE